MIGTTLQNRYRIEGELGRGGMGTVYRAHDLRLDRSVAIKILNRAGLDSDRRARLEREALATAKLSHPNIVSVYDIGEADGTPYIVMEHVSGKTLRALGPLPISQILHIARQLCEALDHAHMQGIVHRDLKPENIMIVEPEGRRFVKLMDLGLAHARGAPRLTEEGMFLGTALYTAPEQVRGGEVDGRADLYALGVMLFELVTGRPPYSGDTLLELLTQHLTAPVPSPSDLRPDVSPSLAAIIVRLLAKQPEQRFQSAAEVCAALAAVPEATDLPALRPTEERLPPAPLPAAEDADWQLDSVPAAPTLIGRQAELARYAEALERQHLAVIEGMAGVGKTVLGAVLAQQEAAQGRRVFWISLDPAGKNNSEALLWDIALFLAHDGKPEPWQYLRQESRQQESLDARPRDRARRLGVLFAALRRGDYTLCLDNFHVLLRGTEPEPDLAYFLNEVRKRVEGRAQAPLAHFVIMAREVTPFLRGLSGGPLQGLSAGDARAFLDTFGVRLPEAQFGALCEKVEGNPQLLRLSIPGLQARAGDPEALSRFINGLVSQQNVRDFLIENLHLSEDEQRVLEALCVFVTPVPRVALEETLADDAPPSLMRLLDRLIQAHQIEELAESGEIATHQLVREYCYSRLDRARRLQLHARAAAYCAAQRDAVMAAYHYRLARDYRAAAQVLLDAAPELMRSGRLDAMLEQIEALARAPVSPEQRLGLCRARADALFRRGAYEQAAAAYQEALALTEPPEAQARLYGALGRCWQARGRFGEAIAAYERQLALAQSAGARALVAEAHLGIGRTLTRQAQYDEAVQHLSEAAQIGEAVGDAVLAARAHDNLGLVQTERGDFAQALDSHRKSLHAFRRAERPELVAAALGNLGRVHHERGEYARAADYYQQAIVIHEQRGDVYYLGLAYNNLGELRLAQGDFAGAVSALEHSVAVAEQTGNDYVLSVASANLAEGLHSLGKPQEAIKRATHALDLARALDLRLPEGIAHAKLGAINASLGQRAEAQAEFESALAVLESLGYKPELARLYDRYGEYLLADIVTRARGAALLARAQALYAEFGSSGESNRIAALLQARA